MVVDSDTPRRVVFPNYHRLDTVPHSMVTSDITARLNPNSFPSKHHKSHWMGCQGSFHGRRSRSHAWECLSRLELCGSDDSAATTTMVKVIHSTGTKGMMNMIELVFVGDFSLDCDVVVSLDHFDLDPM